MIPVNPVPEPLNYRNEAYLPGLKWLDEHPDSKRPDDKWSPYYNHLADGFSDRCGYWGTKISSGEVDHFISWKTAKDTGRPNLAYEWSNFRFSSSSANGHKGNADDRVLDPYEIPEDWFEIILPSLQFKLTNKVPHALRGKALYTLTTLHLQKGKALRNRRNIYTMYQENKLTLKGLKDWAPLIAEAVMKQEAP